jgi:hypothetical protein
MLKTRAQLEAELAEQATRARKVREAIQASSRALTLAEPSETSRPITVERVSLSPVRETKR